MIYDISSERNTGPLLSEWLLSSSPSEPGAVFSSFDFSSLVFHFSCFFFFFFASFSRLSRHTRGGCVFILADLSLFEADNDCGLGNFIEKFSIVVEFLNEEIGDDSNNFHRRITFLLIFI